jgi:hypothetical protein
LCDLDETAWQKFDPETCQKLADAVIHELQLPLPTMIQQRQLPELPNWVKAEDILLEPRTRNCLNERGFLDDPKNLATLTIGQLCRFSGFGKKWLVDLLTSLESFVIWSREQKSGTLNGDITRMARKLHRLRIASGILRDDPRFGHLIREMDIDAKNAREAAAILISRKVDPINPQPLIRRLVDLVGLIRNATHVSLEIELYSLTEGLGSERDRRIIISYLGWDGRPPRTLEAVGKEHDMTRERVRQICDRINKKQTAKPFLPILDRVIGITAAVTPALAGDVEDQLANGRLTNKKFHIESICSAAQVVGREARFIVATFHQRRFVVPCDPANLLDQIDHLARARVSYWGVTSIEDIAAATDITVSFAVKVVTTIPGFKWLDESSGWFWIENVPRNSLMTQIRKILAVSSSISIGELSTGVGRSHRRKGFAPPRRVLLEFCRQLPWCRVTNEVITAAESLNPVEILSDSEQMILQVFKDHGPVMQRARYEELCLGAGMNPNSFWIYLNYSPIITRYASGVFGLRGADVPMGLVRKSVCRKPAK